MVFMVLGKCSMYCKLDTKYWKHITVLWWLPGKNLVQLLTQHEKGYFDFGFCLFTLRTWARNFPPGNRVNCNKCNVLGHQWNRVKMCLISKPQNMGILYHGCSEAQGSCLQLTAHQRPCHVLELTTAKFWMCLQLNKWMRWVRGWRHQRMEENRVLWAKQMWSSAVCDSCGENCLKRWLK